MINPLPRVAPALVPLLKLRYGKEIEVQLEQAGSPDVGGWITLTFTFETEEVAWSHILSFGTMIEVVEPEELREKVAQIATRIASFYYDDQRTLTEKSESY